MLCSWLRIDNYSLLFNRVHAQWYWMCNSFVCLKGKKQMNTTYKCFFFSISKHFIPHPFAVKSSKHRTWKLFMSKIREVFMSKESDKRKFSHFDQRKFNHINYFKYEYLFNQLKLSVCHISNISVFVNVNLE
jgi:hypothetical protein